jgi:hypothetical protein
MMKTNAKRKNSAIKKLVPAAGMLALSASMLATSTYAWFTMNKDVHVTGLQTTARAEEGIVIAAYNAGTGADTGTYVAPSASDFANTDQAYNPTSAQTLLPTFTVNAGTWYHHTSLKSNDGQAYADGSATVVTNGTNGDYYYELNKFQIKASGTSTTSLPVYVKDVEVQSRTGGAVQDYDPCLRILIKSGANVLIFDGTGQRTNTENLLGDAANGTITLTQENKLAAKIINGATTTPTDVEIYMYYDGEDAACMSDNIDAFTAINVNVTFTTETPAS